MFTAQVRCIMSCRHTCVLACPAKHTHSRAARCEERLRGTDQGDGHERQPRCDVIVLQVLQAVLIGEGLHLPTAHAPCSKRQQV